MIDRDLKILRGKGIIAVAVFKYDCVFDGGRKFCKIEELGIVKPLNKRTGKITIRLITKNYNRDYPIMGGDLIDLKTGKKLMVENNSELEIIFDLKKQRIVTQDDFSCLRECSEMEWKMFLDKVKKLHQEALDREIHLLSYYNFIDKIDKIHERSTDPF